MKMNYMVVLYIFIQLLAGCAINQTKSTNEEISEAKETEFINSLPSESFRVSYQCQGSWAVGVSGGYKTFYGNGASESEGLESARQSCIFNQTGTSKVDICKNNSPTWPYCTTLGCGSSKNIYDLGYPGSGNKHEFCRSKGYGTYYPGHTSCYVFCK